MINIQKLSKILSGSSQLWHSKIGRMHYRNNIIIDGKFLYASTSGSIWHKNDTEDGVYCLSPVSGDYYWHYQTAGDANQIAVNGDYIVGGTDGRQLFAVIKTTGIEKTSFNHDEKFLSSPVVIYDGDEPVSVHLDVDGNIFTFRPSSPSFRLSGRIRGVFKANLATSEARSKAGYFFAGSDCGRLFSICMENGKLNVRLVGVVEPGRSSYYDFALGLRGIGSLAVEDDNLIVCYIRDTYDKHPPICSFDISAEQRLWHGRAVRTVSKRDNVYGNARSTPAIHNNIIYSTFSYNDALHAFDLKSGNGVWMCRLDRELHQNWSSPVWLSGKIIVPRVDGTIHVINSKSHKVEKSISVEIGSYISREEHYNQPETLPMDDEMRSQIAEQYISAAKGPGPGDALTAGLASTPIIFEGGIIIGGISGSLYRYNI